MQEEVSPGHPGDAAEACASVPPPSGYWNACVSLLRGKITGAAIALVLCVLCQRGTYSRWIAANGTFLFAERCVVQFWFVRSLDRSDVDPRNLRGKPIRIARICDLPGRVAVHMLLAFVHARKLEGLRVFAPLLEPLILTIILISGNLLLVRFFAISSIPRLISILVVEGLLCGVFLVRMLLSWRGGVRAIFPPIRSFTQRVNWTWYCESSLASVIILSG